MLIPGMFSNSDGGETWPDAGDGFDGTPYTTKELLEQAHNMNVSGVQFRQLRHSIDTYHGPGDSPLVFKYYTQKQIGAPVAVSASTVSTYEYPVRNVLGQHVGYY